MVQTGGQRANVENFFSLQLEPQLSTTTRTMPRSRTHARGPSVINDVIEASSTPLPQPHYSDYSRKLGFNIAIHLLIPLSFGVMGLSMKAVLVLKDEVSCCHTSGVNSKTEA